MGKNETLRETGKLGPEGHVEIRGNTKTPDVLAGTLTERREVRDGVRSAAVSWVLQRCPRIVETVSRYCWRTASTSRDDSIRRLPPCCQLTCTASPTKRTVSPI
jgi:hypothetical protein